MIKEIYQTALKLAQRTSKYVFKDYAVTVSISIDGYTCVSDDYNDNEELGYFSEDQIERAMKSEEDFEKVVQEVNEVYAKVEAEKAQKEKEKKEKEQKEKEEKEYSEYLKLKEKYDAK